MQFRRYNFVVAFRFQVIGMVMFPQEFKLWEVADPGRGRDDYMTSDHRKYCKDKIILGADVNNEKIAVGGWLEESDKDLIPFIQGYQKKGVKYVICTDISKDGMLQGPSFDLYKRIISECNVVRGGVERSYSLCIIASGGISCFEELPKLAELGCEGTIIGKAIYENKISLKQLENYIINK